MECSAVIAGSAFLPSALGHIDCQARTIGSYGWAALADPASPVSLALGGLLTIFVAAFAFRLLLGEKIAGRDLIADLLRVGIVLTLATSWPAWRVVGYDLIIEGPQQLAYTLGRGTGLSSNEKDLFSKLQTSDSALAALNIYGSGRLGIAQGDWLQLGVARAAFLVGTFGSMALVRLAAGILLAIAPFIAGLLLFDIARPIFVGWARALAFTFLGSIMLTTILGVELALMRPWLIDALAKRSTEAMALDAPVEALAITIGFMVVKFGALMVAERIAFHPSSWRAYQQWHGRSSRLGTMITAPSPGVSLVLKNVAVPDRATLISLAITETSRRETRIAAGDRVPSARIAEGTAPLASATTTRLGGNEPLGGSWRRSARRVSAASMRRDQAR